MIRLVHQFDSMGTRPQVASPKSSACSCCCCCCVATTLTSGVLTARAVGRVPPPASPALAADAVSIPDAPDAPLSPEDPPPRRNVLGWKFLGFFMLPIACVLAGLASMFTPNHLGPVVGIMLFLGSYIGGLLMLRNVVGLHGGWILGLVIGLPFAIAAEVALWFGLFFH